MGVALGSGVFVSTGNDVFVCREEAGLGVLVALSGVGRGALDGGRQAVSTRGIIMSKVKRSKLRIGTILCILIFFFIDQRFQQSYRGLSALGVLDEF